MLKHRKWFESTQRYHWMLSDCQIVTYSRRGCRRNLSEGDLLGWLVSRWSALQPGERERERERERVRWGRRALTDNDGQSRQRLAAVKLIACFVVEKVRSLMSGRIATHALMDAGTLWLANGLAVERSTTFLSLSQSADAAVECTERGYFYTRFPTCRTQRTQWHQLGLRPRHCLNETVYVILYSGPERATVCPQQSKVLRW